jgi:hypothetical protein
LNGQYGKSIKPLPAGQPSNSAGQGLLLAGDWGLINNVGDQRQFHSAALKAIQKNTHL